MFQQCNSPSPSSRSTRGVTTSHRLRSPMCCLGANAVVEPEAMRAPRSPYEWLKSTAQELEIRERCRRVKTKIKVTCAHHHHHHHHHINHHQRRQSHSYLGDFSYDLSSYALNFEDDVRADEDGSLPSFTARLPASPVTKSRSSTVDLISF